MSRVPSPAPGRRSGQPAKSGRQWTARAVQRRLETIVARLGERDRRAVLVVVKRVAEVAEQEGQAAALRLVEEIIRIVNSAEIEH